MKQLFFIVCACVLLTACGKKPKADFTWNPQNPEAGEEVEFVNLSTDAKGYQWNLGNMKVSNAKSPKTTYQTSGNFIVELTAQKGIKSDVKTMTITVAP